MRRLAGAGAVGERRRGVRKDVVMREISGEDELRAACAGTRSA
jgi:hypothetical protein